MNRLLVPALAVLVSACSSTPVETGRDRALDLARYRTYVFMQPAEDSEKSEWASMLDLKLKGVIRETLRGKGLTEAASRADLGISYSVIGADGKIYGSDPAPWRFGQLEEDRATREGSLSLAFVDLPTNRMVWQGTAVEALKAGRDTGQVAQALRNLLERFPS
jgi:hypothetical protein